ncbi:alpha/beta fold hydrolase [Aeromicrobium camelliae]|uniref:alpha/beta fold hydrolase n=1 Tax=Aeromicrobium camelliae TaxID=1538144 RepID=UPI001AA07909|nr:alpha/beta hydrolase [Aeromicrobium camelliae]
MKVAPDWFSSAVTHSPRIERIGVEGASIHYRVWGSRDGAPVVLVHGGAAHGGWWDHIGPHLAAEHPVIALDLSGHGDSDHRPSYDLTTWADEVMAVAAAESALPPIIYGHSMGGFVALTAAREHGDRIRGVVAIDSPVRRVSPEAGMWRAQRANPDAVKYYADRAEILARFRTVPEDPACLDYVLAHVAAESVTKTEAGWRWKFDPRVFLSAMMQPEDLAGAACDVALLRGERGMATHDITEVVRERLGGTVPVTVIPDAGHHIMLDQPVALIAALQTLLGQWRVSR